jgi:phosphoribosylanthranilate isomerase
MEEPESSVKIKICGLTRAEDALTAAEAGADFLGFIFYEVSPRYVEPQQVKKIAELIKARLSTPVLVGVFVNESAATMAQVLHYSDLDLAQLSGEESPELITDPSSLLFGRSYKGIRPRSEAEARRDGERYLSPTQEAAQPQLLIDAYHRTLRGGTGEIADWEVAASLARRVPRLMLAGGLNPENVAKAISQVRPFALDVSSGVEESPGIKDPLKIRKFVLASRPV